MVGEPVAELPARGNGDQTAPVDDKIISLLRERDPATLEWIVRENSRRLYKMSRSLGFRNEEAEDLVQDTFIVFLKTLDRFEGRSQIQTWLMGILFRKAKERRRWQELDKRSDSIDTLFESRFDENGNWRRCPEDLEDLFASKEAGALILECLDRVSLQQRGAFLLREVHDLETPEICKLLKVSVTNFGVLMHRARISLRECLAAKGVKRNR